MRRINPILRKLLIFLVLFVAVCVIAKEALDVYVASNTSVVASSEELMGIQGADETTVVAQKQKMRKKGPEGEKAARSLDQISKEKLPLFKVINGALETQAKVYQAYKDEQDAEARKFAEQLKGEIPKARESLTKLRSLTDEQVKVIRSTTKDEQAVRVAEATYSSWKAAVDSLKDEPLTDAELSSRRAAISEGSSEAIKGAQDQAKSIDATDLPEEDKQTLRGVVQGGQNIMSNMQQIMQSMQKIMEEFMGQLTGGGSSKSMNPLAMLQQVTSGGGSSSGGTSKESIDKLQKTLEGVATQIQSFFGNFGPYLQTVGGIVGMPVQIPALPGFGSIGAIQGMGGVSSPVPSTSQSSVTAPAPAPAVPAEAPAGLPTATAAAPADPEDIANTSEGIDAIERFQVDGNVKNMILINHKGGYANFSSGKYDVAFKQFVKAVELYEGNYVDAYWAALTAQKMKKKAVAQEWVAKALAINPLYKPALELQKKLK